MWGSPGTLLAARAMHEWTGEERWLEAWRESAEALMARRDADGLWTQQLYGKTQRLLGPAHGLVGIVHALLQVESEWSASLARETAAILAREAIVEDGLANWPAAAGGPLAPASGSGIRLQWCHGAPGIVADRGAVPRRGAAARRRRADVAARARTATRRAPVSATAPPATATRC